MNRAAATMIIHNTRRSNRVIRLSLSQKRETIEAKG